MEKRQDEIKTNTQTRNLGFTILELLVVIAIIGIISGVVLVALDDSRSKSRDAQRGAQMQELMKAFELYYTQNGVYPDDGVVDGTGDAAVLSTVGPALISGGFMSQIPSDPYYDASEGYLYCASDDGSTYGLFIHTEDAGGGTDFCVVARGPQLDYVSPTGWCTIQGGDELENQDDCDGRF